MTKLLLLDTETTGVSKDDQPIELAMCLFEIGDNGKSISLLDSYEGRRCPTVAIHPRALKVHGISIAELTGHDFDYLKVNSLLSNADFIVAHNASFDRRMLQSLFPEVLKKSWRCTLTQLSWPETSGRSLGAIANLLNVPQVKAHSAMGDVQTLSACLFHPEHRSNFLKSLLSSPDVKFKNEGQDITYQIAESLSPEVQKYCESLLNIIGAVMADGVLHDSEIQYLNDWLERSSLAVAYWPGNLIAKKVSQILEDGVITEEERNALTVTLNEIFNGNLKKATDKFVESPLELDQIDSLDFEGKVFLCTGDFAYVGGKAQSELLIQERGGLVVGNMSKKVNFVVVGGLGSPTWKHGNFGTKVEKAIEYRTIGEPIKIIHEETWTRFL